MTMKVAIANLSNWKGEDVEAYITTVDAKGNTGYKRKPLRPTETDEITLERGFEITIKVKPLITTEPVMMKGEGGQVVPKMKVTLEPIA